MKTDREKIRAAEACGYRLVDGTWFRKVFCPAEEQKDLAVLEAQNAALPEGVLFDSGEMRWYRLVPEDMDEAALRDLLLRRTARDIRHVKKLCIAILAVFITFMIAVALYVIFNARESLG